MSVPLSVPTPSEKRAEVLGRIEAYAAQIARARHGLAHVTAMIELFAAPERHRARCIVSHGAFKTGEIADTCIRHLGVAAELTTRELAERVMAERDLAERDLDISDTGLRTSVIFKGVQALRVRNRRPVVLCLPGVEPARRHPMLAAQIRAIPARHAVACRAVNDLLFTETATLRRLSPQSENRLTSKRACFR